ncbi:MAG: toxic anion resistance protein [bacterium]|nr:toxic anion resistance protein [bacterium]
MEKSVGLAEKQFALVIPDAETVKQELVLATPNKVVVRAQLRREDPEAVSAIDDFVTKVLAYDPNKTEQIEAAENIKVAVQTMGEKTQRESAQISNSPMLKSTIRTLASKGEDGGEVAKTLLELNHQVIQLDPSDMNFGKKGVLKRTLYAMPFVGSPIAKYFTKFQAADSIIAEIVQSLINGREQLDRDNKILADDKKRMLFMTIRLNKAIALGRMLDDKLSAALQEMGQDDPRHQFISEELIFPLRQRILDLEQQLAVNQQGVITFEVIIRNNRELINGVRRAEMVTVNALNIAVTAALALGHQSFVLKALQTTNKTTSGLIRSTSARLKKQAVQVHEQASGAMLEIEDLQQSFQDLRETLVEIATYRQKALPVMKQNMDAMFALGEQAQEAIEKMERGDRVAPVVTLDVIR